MAFTIITAAAVSADPRYSGINPPNVGVTCFDDDVAAVVVRAPPLLEVSETGTTATFSMVLTTQPSANVRCAVQSSNPNEGTISPAFAIFTSADFDQDHAFTITGVDDTADGGNQLFIINTLSCTSTDLAYSGVNPRDVNVRNVDDD